VRKCKNCNGKGWLFVKGNVFTGKYESFFGVEMPKYTAGKERVTCTRCFGKGLK